MDALTIKIIKSILIFFILDMVYINYIIKTPFSDMMFRIQGSKMSVKMLSALLCYIVLFYVFYYFILSKKFESNYQQIKEAFILGFCIYAIYDLTNHATIKEWSYSIVLIDSVWGGILFALTAYLIHKY